MLSNCLRNALAAAILAGALPLLGGCTLLISEKPVFSAADFDTSPALLGHYSDISSGGTIAVTRGADASLRLYGFALTGGKGKAHWHQTQSFYAEGAAVALGGGDFALQFSCAAWTKGGKVYSSPAGGTESPFGHHTIYGTAARDRKKDNLWITTNFDYASNGDKDSLFSRYAIEKRSIERSKKKSGANDFGIVPPGMSGTAARAFFRDLIATDMANGDASQLYRKSDSEPALSDDEKAAVALSDGAACARAQDHSDPLNTK